AVAKMKAAGVTAALLPGTAFFLGLPYAPARKFLETGVRVALASDFNPGSSMGFNLQLVMTMAVSQMKMTLEEALLGVTLHAAHAMGLEGEIGSLAPGKLCDLILCDVPSWQHVAYFCDRAVTVAGGRITGVAPLPPDETHAPDVVRLPGKALLPGTVNTHCHTFQSLLRGLGDDLDFMQWRDRVLYPYSTRLDREGI